MIVPLSTETGVFKNLHLHNNIVKILNVNVITYKYSTKQFSLVKWDRIFNDTLNTFYLWLYGVKHVVKDHSDSERGNLLSPHGLLFPINSNGSFICTIPHTL